MVFDPDRGCVRRPFARPVEFPHCCPYHEDGGMTDLPCPVTEPPAPPGFTCRGCENADAHKRGPHHAKWCSMHPYVEPPAPNFDKLEEAIRHGVSGGYSEDCMVMVDGQ